MSNRDEAIKRILELCDQIDNASFDLEDYRQQIRVQEAIDRVREEFPAIEK